MFTKDTFLFIFYISYQLLHNNFFKLIIEIISHIYGLESEQDALSSRSEGYFSDPWNMMDCLTYVSVLVVIVTRIVAVSSSYTF